MAKTSMVNRDIKRANILMCDDFDDTRNVAVCDFGIAARLADAGTHGCGAGGRLTRVHGLRRRRSGSERGPRSVGCDPTRSPRPARGSP